MRDEAFTKMTEHLNAITHAGRVHHDNINHHSRMTTRCLVAGFVVMLLGPVIPPLLALVAGLGLIVFGMGMMFTPATRKWPWTTPVNYPDPPKPGADHDR